MAWSSYGLASLKSRPNGGFIRFMDLQEILYLAAVIVFALACRTFENRFIQKLGWLSLLAASYLGAYFLTQSHAAGACGIALWFMLPWVEIVVRVRQLRFQLKNKVSSRFPPNREQFPELAEITQEILAQGYEQAEDAGWKWSQVDHFVRLFYQPERRTQATVALAQQEGFAFSYVTLTSRGRDGLTYVTTNFPFPPTMRFHPQQRVQRYHEAASMAEMESVHQSFLTAQKVQQADLCDLRAEEITAQVEQEMHEQIRHNLNVGVLELTGEDEYRYSWRGCFFLWAQIVKDMIRV
jgi:hypothetical protein